MVIEFSVPSVVSNRLNVVPPVPVVPVTAVKSVGPTPNVTVWVIVVACAAPASSPAPTTPASILVNVIAVPR